MRITWVILLLAVAVNAEPDSTGTQPQKPASTRLATKVLTGTIVGAVGCMLGAALPLSLVEADEPEEEELFWFNNRDVATFLGGSLGYVGGAALGVKKVDPESSFRSALLGSSLGYVAGIALILGQPALFPVAVFAPVFGAVAFSGPSPNQRLSVDGSPARVTARWRF